MLRHALLQAGRQTQHLQMCLHVVLLKVIDEGSRIFTLDDGEAN